MEKFLERIGLGGIELESTVEFLGKVQNACVLTIPYENIDILEGKPISLDPSALYEKIVLRRRGGYCFEVNALLHHMLEVAGFETESFFARFLRGEMKIPFRRHRIVVVTLGEDRYMLDVGVGQIAPRFPLRLVENEIQVQNGETYKFELDDKLGWILFDLKDGEWRSYISFTEDKQFDADFIPASFWCEKHPDSPFNKKYMLAIKTPDGRKTLDGNTFKCFTGDTLTHIEEADNKRLSEILLTEFGLKL